MQKLTAMTLGSLALAFAAFAVDANAQPPTQPAPRPAAVCDAHEVAVYFAKDSAELNQYSRTLLAGFVEDARICGAQSVTVQAMSNPAHARAVVNALKANEVEPIVLRAPLYVPVADTIAARSVTVRVAPLGSPVG